MADQPKNAGLRQRLAAAFDGGNDPFSLEVMRSVVQSVPSYLAAVSPDGELLYMHRFVNGYGPEHLEGTKLYDFLDDDSREPARRCVEGVVRSRRPDSFRCIARRPPAGGAPPHYEIRVAPIAEAGEVIALSLVATDITAEKHAQRALQASQKDLALAVEATGMGIWSWDARTDEVTWDEMMFRHFGLPSSKGAKTYQDYVDLVLPEDREDVVRSIRRAMKEGSYGDILHRIRVDGEVRWLLIKGHVIFDEAGKAIGLRGGVFDVTDRKRLDLKIRERQKIEALGELAAGIAHNFNNMLAAIMGNLSALERIVPPDAREHTQAALAASNAAAQIVHDLSSLTRRERNPQRRQLPLREVVDRVASIVRSTFTKQIQFEVENRLERGDDPRIEALGRDLEHALLNLCINARDAAMEADGSKPQVRLVMLRRPPRPGDARHWVEVVVHDNGLGMSPEVRDRIFEPFFTTKEGKGTGMGLFTAHRTVNEHGGLLEVESRPGRGSSFSVLLPELPPDES